MQTPPPQPVIIDGVDRTAGMLQGPATIYEALTNQREVLGQQLRLLERQRAGLNTDLQRGNVQGASRSGVENRIIGIDKRIENLEKQIAGVDAQVASAAAVPGAIVPDPRENMPDNGVPEEAFVLGGLFMIIVMLPLTIAYARRIWRRSATAVSSIPADLMARLSRIEQAVDTSAVEIERIGEGQRFITKLFSDARVPALPPSKDIQ